MADEKKTFWVQIKDIYNRLTLSQKAFIGFVAVLTVVGIFLITAMVNSIRYGVLFSNLPMKDSGLIIEKLKEKKIAYEISGGGSIIRVPEDKVSELRIQLASEGLPEGGGIGFEIFDKQSFSTTDFVQNINYIRALEGELARSISQIKEVLAAKVHITLPKKSVFIENQEPAKASIILKLKPGAVLSNSIIPAIMHLTAQSVEGLVTENIAVIDINGRLLSKPRGEGDSFDETAVTQMAYQRKLEETYTKKIIDLLEPIVGVDKVRADVRLNLDFNKIEIKKEDVDPDRTVKISEQSENVTSSGPSATQTGVPGVASNVVQGSGGNSTASNANPAKNKTEKTTTNYEVSKTTTHQIKPVGEIRNLSVAVVVDDAVVNNQGAGEGQARTLRPRTPQELDQLKRVVQAAMGFNADRGDRVEVANLSFDTSTETANLEYIRKQQTNDIITKAITYAAYLLGALLIFFLIIKPIMRRMGGIYKQVGRPIRHFEQELPPVDVERIATIQNARDDAEIEKELMEKYRVPKEVKKMTILKDRVQEFAKGNPDSAASLIKSFMFEEK